MKTLSIENRNSTDDVLHLECRLSAPPERVFRAWSQPDELGQWFKPEPSFTVQIDRFDFRVGGGYRMVLVGSDDTFPVVGEFLEVEPPSRLVMTWQWEESKMQPGPTQVTVLIHADGTGSRLELIHERLASVESRDNHKMGWSGTLAALEELLANA